MLVAKKDFYSVWTYKSKDGEKDKVSQSPPMRHYPTHPHDHAMFLTIQGCIQQPKSSS